MISTHIQIKTGERRIPELLAIAAMTLLLIHIADGYITLITNHGFLPMSIDKKPFGISTFGISTFGISSILFFFMAFGIEIRENRRTRLTTTLLIVGGALIACTVLGKSAMDYGGLSRISPSFLTLIVVGYIIMGLGILKVFRQSRI
ncbi:MAG: hypothetical protein WBE34_03640 [Candidatus Nitrosopolaris sp.]